VAEVPNQNAQPTRRKPQRVNTTRARARRAQQQRRRRQVRGPGTARAKRPGVEGYQRSARMRLNRFRQGSMLAVSITALLLLLWGAAPETEGQEPAEETTAAAAAVDTATTPVPDATEAVREATSTIRELLLNFYALLPKLLIAVLLIVAAGLIARGARVVVHRTLRRWEKSEAVGALVRLGCYLIAIGAALSILAGDARALLGSVGLVGLALSWALQTPIESFTGWLLNSFRGYYRVGDRIEVGEVFGDVYKIDVLTTTVWEAGGPGKSVAGAQSTGAMITFPNWEVLRSNIVNYSRDFPYVWDEVTISIANESDLTYAKQVFENAAAAVIGEVMREPARAYQALLERARLAFDVAEKPEVFITLADAWTNCTVRYLVPARQRRRWATAMLIGLTNAAAAPGHAGRIISAYPRNEVVLRRSWSPEDAIDNGDGKQQANA
jgi:small conductance mechanosensitive channel